ncbi:MAG: tyrosine--tRNA ligase [Rickettsiales bacterium]|jgi:tyrosyl-tRNA synthetase|nr:tyrosine--tRNA ligase [Rickettsiales bacterium]
MFRSKFLIECERRGFLNQCTNMDELDRMLCSGKPVVAYWGTDPTGPSLHIGHLFSLMILRLFQRYGNKPLVLVGCATGQIGDPTLKDKSRPMMDLDTLEKNKRGIQRSVSKFIEFGDGPSDAILVDNLDWWKNTNYLEMLRDLGPHISVNRMLSFDSVKLRLSKEEHMSFLEFNYMVLQAYDFYHLYKKYGCALQLCGADQWGNVVAGVELVRRLQFAKDDVENGTKTEVIGLSTPLLLDSNGKKLGKSEGNALWVNEEMLNPFEYFQYFRNVNDPDVLRFLRIYTDMPLEEMESMGDRDINELKKILAFETTKMCHGKEIAEECLERSEQIFERGNIDYSDTLEYRSTSDRVPLYILLRELDLVKSNGESRRLIEGGGVRIDNEKITNGDYVIQLAGNQRQFGLSIGRKKIVKVVVTQESNSL